MIKPELKKQELKKVGVIFLAWGLLALIVIVAAPPEWKWAAALPLGLIVLALIITGIGVVLMRLGYFKPRIVYVHGRQITACAYCPNIAITENPVNKDFPVYKCSVKVMRTVYNPSSVPGWCSYAHRK
jgi:hypothetical protein